MAPLSLTLLIITLSLVNGQIGTETTMVFYLQDVATGPNATAVPVTGIIGRDWNFDNLGTVFAIDDPVMLSPSPLSTVVGRAQGLMTVSAQDGANVNAVLSIVFSNSNGQYGGSTLEIQGVSRQRQSYKELSVVSGTGRFRFARGYASLQTAYYDPQTAHSIIRLTLHLRPS